MRAGNGPLRREKGLGEEEKEVPPPAALCRPVPSPSCPPSRPISIRVLILRNTNTPTCRPKPLAAPTLACPAYTQLTHSLHSEMLPTPLRRQVSCHKNS
ncbi:hypothetical protein E2C01_071008 [Portunus trituberculatus]|uniref:Uncharacterized protein n=1 Tax=Portunus trituberculatus TaxID=210409 RepID=A0A5B7HU93_PORTR|nr:hypothetical protein [Portunus trituberculatus]